MASTHWRVQKLGPTRRPPSTRASCNGFDPLEGTKTFDRPIGDLSNPRLQWLRPIGGYKNANEAFPILCQIWQVAMTSTHWRVQKHDDGEEVTRQFTGCNGFDPLEGTKTFSVDTRR